MGMDRVTKDDILYDEAPENAWDDIEMQIVNMLHNK